MSLYTRLMGLTEPKISVHAFYSMMAQRKRGRVTNQQVIDAFGLSAAEQTELTTLWGRVNTDALNAQEIDDVLILAEQRIAPYTTEAAVKTAFGV